MIFQIEHTRLTRTRWHRVETPKGVAGSGTQSFISRRYILEYYETAAYAHTRLRESIEDSLLELSGRLEQRSQIEGNATWAQVADLRRLDDLLEQALEFFKSND